MLVMWIDRNANVIVILLILGIVALEAMNLAEGLARELVRVAKLRVNYESVGSSGAYAVAMIDATLEKGILAAGSDVVTMIAAYQALKDIES